jgi:hypothetical protein
LQVSASTENERPGRRLYALSRLWPHFFMWVRYIQLVSSQKQINIRSRNVVQKATGSIQTSATLAISPAAEAHSMWASASEVETFRPWDGWILRIAGPSAIELDPRGWGWYPVVMSANASIEDEFLIYFRNQAH